MQHKNLVSLVFVFIIGFFFTKCSSAGGKRQGGGDDTTLNPSGFVFDSISPQQAAIYAAAVEDFYNKRLVKTGFSGHMLVAKNGKIIFEKYRGYSNFIRKDSMTAHSPVHIASTSKPFTAMAILKLWENGKLSLDDTLQQYFPQFPYKGITIRSLLSHRSGLPNYLYFMDSLWPRNREMTNEDVLNALITHKPRIQLLPNRRFQYCNTNFILLALVLEKITGQAFPDYMKATVFEPLGMHDTFVFSLKDSANYNPTWSVSRGFPMDQYDCTYGDKNIYSTARDLLAWDKALYQQTYLKQSTLQMAFTPLSNEVRSMHNYGLGWRLFIKGGDTLIYHNGKWHGTNTAFIRLVQDTATIIVLGNKENRAIYQAKEMEGIFSGKYDLDNLEE